MRLCRYQRLLRPCSPGAAGGCVPHVRAAHTHVHTHTPHTRALVPATPHAYSMQHYASMARHMPREAFEAAAQAQLRARLEVLDQQIQKLKKSGLPNDRAHTHACMDEATQTLAHANTSGPTAARVQASHDLLRAVLAFVDTHRSAALPLSASESEMLSWLQFVAVGTHNLTECADAVHTHTTLPIRRHAVLPLLVDVATDVRAFSVEKFGVAPEVVFLRDAHVVTDTHPRAHDSVVLDGTCDLHGFLGRKSYVQFIASELLKNSFRAHIERFGPAGVDDALPVYVCISRKRSRTYVRVSDFGGGAPTCAAGAMERFPYFASTAAASQRAEPNYQYSREFGASFTGFGVGLARSAVYAESLGGKLVGFNTPGHGVDMLLEIDATGASAWDWRDPPSG